MHISYVLLTTLLTRLGIAQPRPKPWGPSFTALGKVQFSGPCRDLVWWDGQRVERDIVFLVFIYVNTLVIPKSLTFHK